MTFKRVTSAIAGDATHFGGLDVNKFSDYLGGTDIGGSETVTINTATTFNSGKATLTNPVFSLTGGINMRSTATGPQGFEFGPNETTGGASFMDWHTDSGDGDYRLRLIRNSGANGDFDIINTGTGNIKFIPAAGGGVEISDSFLELDTMTVPADPATNDGRIYMKVIDANNNGLFIKIKQGGVIVEKTISLS